MSEAWVQRLLTRGALGQTLEVFPSPTPRMMCIARKVRLLQAPPAGWRLQGKPRQLGGAFKPRKPALWAGGLHRWAGSTSRGHAHKALSRLRLSMAASAFYCVLFRPIHVTRR